MMRFFLALCVLLAGCLPKETPPIADDFTPYIAVAIGLTAGSRVVPDVPSDTCENCGGLGYLGDGTTRVDCPECETAWQELPLETESLDTLSDETVDDERIVNLPDVTESRLSELDQLSDAPAIVANPSGSDLPAAMDWMPYAEPEFVRHRFLANMTGRNLVLVFAMPEGCEPCRIQERDVFSDPEVIEYLTANCVMCLVDYTAHPELVKAWCADESNPNPGAPAVVVVSIGGKWRRVGCGLITVDSFLDFVETSIFEMER